MIYSSDVIKQRWTDYKKKKVELGESFESEYFGESKSARKHRLSFLGKYIDLKYWPYLTFRYAFIGDG